MNIFVAGATGAIGQRLIPMLVKAGHAVTGTTRHAHKAMAIHQLGATPAIMNALNQSEVLKAVQAATPEVVIHQLTAIPASFNLRRFDQQFAATNRLRTEGTDHLLKAANLAGCRRFIAQSYAGWPYARTGGWIKTEDDPLMTIPEPGFRNSLSAIVHVESRVLRESKMEGFVLRYGGFYGPGTSLGEGAPMLEEVRRRHVPVVGRGTGYWSFVHIDDAAAATLAAVEAATPGIYNIVDDEPAPVSEWLPYLAKTLGAAPPRHVPAWLGRLFIGAHGVAMMTAARGASNRKAKSLLQWKLRWPSWRQGFRDGLGEAVYPTSSGTTRAIA
ncbi:MAG TPA: NAD(P)-dependent oxidoreductase [Terriglobales bacterium]